MNDNFNSVVKDVVTSGHSVPDRGSHFAFDVNCRMAAEEISDWLDEIGFSAEHPIDPGDFKIILTEIIKRNIEGNVNYAK